MSRWDDEDCWSDRDDRAHIEPIRRRFPGEPEEPDPAPVLLAVEDAFEGSIYWIRDLLWGFQAPDRVAHPGLCVRALVREQQALLLKGTSVREERARFSPRYEEVIVEPTGDNGLDNPTAFDLDPRPIDLRILRRIHLDEGARGRLCDAILKEIQARLAELERAFEEDQP